MSSDRFDPSRTLPAEPEGIARQRIRVTLRMLGSLLLGGVAIMGSVLVFRQGLLPLIDTVFQPGPAWLSVFRRAGIILVAMAGYWAYVHWHEKRKATELQLQPVPLILGGVGGAALVALPIVMLFAFGAYELVLFRGASPALLGVAALIGIAATLEEWSTAACCFGCWSGPGERWWHWRCKWCCSPCRTWRTWRTVDPAISWPC